MREAANGVDGLKYYEVLAMDERGNITSSKAGNGLTTLRNFDQKTGFIKDIQTGLVGQVQSLAYEFDGVGNLRARIDYNNLDITDTTQSLYEEFEYDDLNRLTKVKRNLSGNLLTTQEMSYAHNGNILSKSDVQSGAAYN